VPVELEAFSEYDDVQVVLKEVALIRQRVIANDNDYDDIIVARRRFALARARSDSFANVSTDGDDQRGTISSNVGAAERNIDNGLASIDTTSSSNMNVSSLLSTDTQTTRRHRKNSQPPPQAIVAERLLVSAHCFNYLTCVIIRHLFVTVRQANSSDIVAQCVAAMPATVRHMN
jgi:hypothetical protein